MKVTFLGTNGWYDTETGNTCSVLVQSSEYDIILDAGNGIAKADRYIKQDKPVYLFISHFHLDHIAGLHTLVKFKFPEGLTICGQIGTHAILNRFVTEPFTVPFEHLSYPVAFRELGQGAHSIQFPVTCLPLVHPAPCFGYRLTLDDRILVAGAKYKGEFEERLKSVVKEVVSGEGEIVLFIDEIHTLVAAGGGEGAMDAANILKPALARGELRAIGATTLNEYQKYFEKDKALERRFQPVMVNEPDTLDAISILRGLKERYETYHHVRIKDEAISAAVELSQRYIDN